MTSSAIVMLHRASAASVSLSAPGQGLGPADPFAAGREIAWTGPAAAAGRVEFAGAVAIDSFPHTEVMIVLAGALTLSVEGAPAISVLPESGVVVARGTRLRIEAAAGTRWAFHAATSGTGPASGVTLLSADATLSPSAPPPAETLIGLAPQCRSFNAFTDEASTLRAGLWDSTPYARISRPHKLSELMHILDGSVDLTCADGTVFTVGRGDTVLVPQGAPCAWDNRVPVAKFYVVQEALG
ncbi:cupin domain-containing protein [Bosea sp. 124]|uniref:cupin domain-containing protein n=1 Tax=Bosea sp. 124 TaxID=2135642 RepID=UPI000D457FBA|nr:cupin domain-containing protein [Bosea sp. 124]PTM42108.1 putative cupin superfamily protein [Bosea sp. 124]